MRSRLIRLIINICDILMHLVSLLLLIKRCFLVNLTCLTDLMYMLDPLTYYR